MGMLKGQKEYARFKESKPLTRKQAILAQCYDCNAEHADGEDGKKDCLGRSCPLYEYFPYRGK